MRGMGVMVRQRDFENYEYYNTWQDRHLHDKCNSIVLRSVILRQVFKSSRFSITLCCFETDFWASLRVEWRDFENCEYNNSWQHRQLHDKPNIIYVLCSVVLKTTFKLNYPWNQVDSSNFSLGRLWQLWILQMVAGSSATVTHSDSIVLLRPVFKSL